MPSLSAGPAVRPSAPTVTWHLLVQPNGRPGAENMALDQGLLEEADRTGRAFLRLYRFDPPCLSLGRNEPAAARYDPAALAERRLDVVRRPTGGRAVWHEHELTYAVAAPIATFGSLRETYCAIHERLAAALRTLGVDARLAPNGPTGRLSDSPTSCFAAPVGGEGLIGDRKVVGSAQVRRGAAFLQHGSILLDGSQDVVARVSRLPAAGSRATTLSDALGRPVAFDEVATAIVGSWGEPVVQSDGPTVQLSDAFSDSAWTWRR